MADPAQASDNLSKMHEPVLPMYGKMKLGISQKEIVYTFKVGEMVMDINIHKNESARILMKRSNGNLIEYHKTDKKFWTISDDGKLKLYFKRKDTVK